ncbi:MAG: TldD/PmbA family protein [Deltaproteobacteria bacterium]|nr:TldD/PmbA family protein [Deltaproteobacteria bacterium]
MQEQQKGLSRLAELACEHAKKKGAQNAAASGALSRSFKLKLRDGKKEEVKASTSRSLTLRLFVDGRYGSHTTSILDDKALLAFIDDAIEMTRMLSPDPHRGLAEAKLYAERPTGDLHLFDPAQSQVTMDQRYQRALAAHDAARAAAGDKLLSVQAGVFDSSSLRILRTTNGFSDAERSTAFGQWAMVSVRDKSERRPSDWQQNMSRSLAQLGAPEDTGKGAAARALGSIGADRLPSQKLPLLVENRAVSRLLNGLLAPLYGSALDQRSSCFEKSAGKQVASPLLSLTDDPALTAGWRSRRFDDEGISAKKRAIVEKGILKSFFLDTYYARKLKQAPTSGGPSNLVFAHGDKTLEALVQSLDKAILVTSFLGGNSNSTTGDFSHGIQGFFIEKGKRAKPIAAMNIASNHMRFWRDLQAVGNDPYLYSSKRTPSLLFAPMMVAGV